MEQPSDRPDSRSAASASAAAPDSGFRHDHSRPDSRSDSRYRGSSDSRPSSSDARFSQQPRPDSHSATAGGTGAYMRQERPDSWSSSDAARYNNNLLQILNLSPRGLINFMVHNHPGSKDD